MDELNVLGKHFYSSIGLFGRNGAKLVWSTVTEVVLRLVH
jgi:hypothetical protein